MLKKRKKELIGCSIWVGEADPEEPMEKYT